MTFFYYYYLRFALLGRKHLHQSILKRAQFLHSGCVKCKTINSSEDLYKSFTNGINWGARKIFKKLVVKWNLLKTKQSTNKKNN